MSLGKSKILIVDDFESQRVFLKDLLSNSFEVMEAEDANAAIHICKNEKIELVITDIKLPGQNGIDLIKILRKESPQTKCVLMTSYNIDDYISVLKHENLLVIVPKSSLMEDNFILGLVHKIINKTLFGLQNFYPQVKYVDVKLIDLKQILSQIEKTKDPSKKQSILSNNFYYICRFNNEEESDTYKTIVGKILVETGANQSIMQIIEELTTNALRYSPKEKPIEIGFGNFGDSVVVGVTDYAGVLNPTQVLLYLERQITIDTKSGLPLGLKDIHGRGLYICRESSNHLIINVEKDKKTEILAILDHKSTLVSKSISMFEK